MSSACPDCQGELIEGKGHKCPDNVTRLIQPNARYVALCTKCGSSKFRLFIKADQEGMKELVGSECIICKHQANYETTFIHE